MVSMSMCCPRKLQRVAILCILAIAFWAVVFRTSCVLWSPSDRQKNVLVDVKNSTLGFQKVFVISLPRRTDKRDAITLASSVTGFDFEWMNGVDGTSVPDKAVPSIFTPGTADKVVGCWRAHMNVYATVVKNRISTALVMEDDADWDVSLKHQLQNFAVGSQHILYGEHTQSFNSPYGDEWDLLWLGHCGSAPGHHDSRRHVLENDPTVPPIERRVNEVDTPDMTEFSNNTRIVYAASSGFCMYGYAVSYHGAQKLLHHLSLHPYHEAVDLSINRLCGNSSYSFTCVSVFPQLFNSHRAAGSISGDTDIGDLSELKDTIRKKSYTHNIVYSTRLNMGRLVKGCETAQSQWPDDTR